MASREPPERPAAGGRPARKQRKAPAEGRRLAVDERRAQLLDLGLGLFAATTYDELSIDAIARAAGISKGLLYHYFPSKRDYYVATVRVAAERLLAATEAASADLDASPLVLLERGLDAYLDFVERHGQAYAALLRSGIGSDPEILELVDGTRSALVLRIAERIGVAPDNALAQTALRGWIGFVEVTSLEWQRRRDLDRERLRELMAAMLIATLLAAEIDLGELAGA